MYRDGVDEQDVRMEDVLCDFCHRSWSEEIPFLEGHRGAMICGHCLAVAWTEIHVGGPNVAESGYFCRMSRESDEDRAALGRAGEPGWRSPVDPDAAIARRFIKQAAGVLHKDPDFDWRKPEIGVDDGPRD